MAADVLKTSGMLIFVYGEWYRR